MTKMKTLLREWYLHLKADEDDSGEIEFPEFLKVIRKQKEAMGNENDESDTIDAFVALGGQVRMDEEQMRSLYFFIFVPNIDHKFYLLSVTCLE